MGRGPQPSPRPQAVAAEGPQLLGLTGLSGRGRRRGGGRGRRGGADLEGDGRNQVPAGALGRGASGQKDRAGEAALGRRRGQSKWQTRRPGAPAPA